MIVTAQQLMDLQNEIGHGVVVSATCSPSQTAMGVKIEWRSPGRKDFGMEFRLTHRDVMNGTVDQILRDAARKTRHKIESLEKEEGIDPLAYNEKLSAALWSGEEDKDDQ